MSARKTIARQRAERIRVTHVFHKSGVSLA